MTCSALRIRRVRSRDQYNVSLEAEVDDEVE